MSKPLNCFILAAGLGERMRPITNHIPKPLLPIAGKPILETIIEKVLSLPVNKIGINIHYKKEFMEEWVGSSSFSRHVTLFPENPILDTGGALKNAASFLAGADFIVHNGDIASDIDLSALIEQHRNSKNLVTLAVHNCPRFNNVVLDGNGFLKGVGKDYDRGDSERLVAFTGIAVYSAGFLKLLPPGASSVVTSWIKAINAGYRVGTFDVSGCSWSDIGSPASYVSTVIQSLRSAGEAAYIDRSTQSCGDIEIDGCIIIEKGCTLGKASYLRNCLILPRSGTEEGGHYENCIIGPDYIIDIEETAFGLPVESKGLLIGTGGSDRKYFRVRNTAGSRVLMECRADDQDFSRHLEYTVFLRKYGVPVPEMYGADFGNRSAYFEDLGDMSLYTWLKCPRRDEEIERVYEKVLDMLVQLHCAASDYVSECPSLAVRIFDYDYLRWETDYFVERFVKGLKNVNVSDSASLNNEFHRLALKVGAFPKRIIHRDFQSQNIMMTRGGIPRIIDYQGARMAPPAYDVASVLWDPYAPLKYAMRERLLSYYASIISDRAGSWFSAKEFAESLLYCRLQRHMQALGAYGYLSMVKGKTYFLKHVPEGLRLLQGDVSEVRGEFPALFDLVSSLKN